MVTFGLIFLLIFVFVPNLYAVNGNQNQLGNQNNDDNLQIEIINEGEKQGETEIIEVEVETEEEGSEEIEEKIPLNQRTRARNQEELKLMIQQKQTEMNQQMNALSESEQNVYRNQNTVRATVHSLLAMEDLVGGIGRQVAEIAREFNNSVQKTIQAEQRIQNRNKLVRFLIGGDLEVAEELENEVFKNKAITEMLKGLRENCECDEEMKTIFQEQIQNLEKEQTRLQKLAQEEKSNRGIFGWLIDLFR